VRIARALVVAAVVAALPAPVAADDLSDGIMAYSHAGTV
jgi:hypothetical protein